MEQNNIIEKSSMTQAKQGEIEIISDSLGYHLLPEIQAAFKDKVERYIRKSDRDVIIARIREQMVGYCMVIDQLDPPDSLSPDIRNQLYAYGCITGLGVNPEWRRNGIGARLVKEGIHWMEHRGLPGIWLRTRVMAEWYKKHLQFEIVGSMTVKKTVIKAVLARCF